MRSCLAFLTLTLLAATTAAQATFEPQAPPCGYMFPIGCGAPGDPEGVSWNGIGGPGASTVDIPNTAGMPCQGMQYARMRAEAPAAGYAVPAGGPMPEPGPGVVNQLYIPIPPMASSVTLCWDFYNAEGPASGVFNDGMSIDIVGPPCGPSFFNIAYADTFTPLGPLVDAGSLCPSGLPEVMPPGPNIAGPIFFPMGAAWIRVCVWNGGDNTFDSYGVVDCVSFGTYYPGYTCTLGQPAGPGSALHIVNSGGLPGNFYVNAMTQVADGFPAGWFFGVGIPLPDLIAEVLFGDPFYGPLDCYGNRYQVIPGPIPPGITAYIVSIQLTPGGLPVTPTPPFIYVTL